MQRITIPVLFKTEKTKANDLAGKDSPDSDFTIRPIRINRNFIEVYYARLDDQEKPSGSIIETKTGSCYTSPLTPAEIDNTLDTIDDEEFVRDLNRAGLADLADLVPGTFDDQINNMLNPNDQTSDN